MPLQRRRLTQEVAAAVQQRIVQLGLRPGDRLPSHTELADDLSISIPSLREGLQVLAALGIVRLEHGRGTIVGRPSVADYLASVDPHLLSRAYASDECVEVFASTIDPLLPGLIRHHQHRDLLAPTLGCMSRASTAADIAEGVRTYYAALLEPLRRRLTADVIELSLRALLSRSAPLDRLGRGISDLLEAMRALAAALKDGDEEASRTALGAQRLALERLVPSEDRSICATGSIGGTFYTAGLEISTAMRELSGVELRPVPTPGGVENLELLSNGEVDVAFTQASIARAAALGEPPFSRAMPDLRVICRTHPLDLWIVTGASTDITDLTSLSGRRVSVGTRAGYTSYVSHRLLELYGDAGPTIDEVYLSISQATAALSRGEIDVLFYLTGGMGTAISRLAELRDLRLLSIAPDVIEEISRLEPGVVPSVIKADPDGPDTRTIRVDAFLVCREQIPDSRAAAVWEAARFASRSSEVLDPWIPACEEPLQLHRGVDHDEQDSTTSGAPIGNAASETAGYRAPRRWR